MEKEYNEKELASAKKDDGDKVSLELLPPSYWAEVKSWNSYNLAMWYFYEDTFPVNLGYDSVPILEFGKCKYSAHNWHKGMRWGRFVGAFHRHCNYKDEEKGLWLPRDLDEQDPETSVAHGCHAECNRVFLQEYYTAWRRSIFIGDNDCAWNDAGKGTVRINPWAGEGVPPVDFDVWTVHCDGAPPTVSMCSNCKAIVDTSKGLYCWCEGDKNGVEEAKKKK